MAIIGYHTIQQALAARGITAEVFMNAEGSKAVRVKAPAYAEKEHVLPTTYSAEYTDEEVLRYAYVQLSTLYRVRKLELFSFD